MQNIFRYQSANEIYTCPNSDNEPPTKGSGRKLREIELSYTEA